MGKRSSVTEPNFSLVRSWRPSGGHWAGKKIDWGSGDVNLRFTVQRTHLCSLKISLHEPYPVKKQTNKEKSQTQLTKS